MQVLVLYYSRTGHTQKLAESICRGVESIDGVNGLLKDTTQVTEEDFLDSDGVIAGSPVYFASMAAELKSVFDRFLKTRRRMEGKVGAAFATSADPSGGKETTMLSILQAMLLYGMIIVGDPMLATGHFGVACSGPPTSEILDNAFKLGQRVAELVQQLSPNELLKNITEDLEALSSPVKKQLDLNN